MIQNVILSTNKGSLLIGANNSSEFVKWITEKFETPTELSAGGVKAVMNSFDSRERSGVVFRGTLLDWLWDNQGQSVKAEIK